EEKKNPSSKIFVSDVKGEAQIDTGKSIEEITKRAVYSAQGTVIETKKAEKPEDKDKIFSSMVYSNGTGAYFEQDTRVEVRKFVQEPFSPNRSDYESEPSISQTEAFVSRGVVGLCTSNLVAGSQMKYQTPFAQVNIRGRKVVIDSKDNQTTISMLEGESTIRTGTSDIGGTVIKAGQQAVITPGLNGAPNKITVSNIPTAQVGTLTDKVTSACDAKKTVYFEAKEKQTTTEQLSGLAKTTEEQPKQGEKSAEKNDPGTGPITAFDNNTSSTGTITGGGQIVVIPTVPVELPVKFTVSPATIVTGGGG
ncbi:MAG: hypothetical protein RLZZ15_3225, partial [Verrucomicrobiota bacterium]